MRAFRVVAGSCGGAAALAACHGVSRPLHIVWDLDETLVSSRQIERVSGEPPLTPNQILHIKRSEAVPSIEHIDDDAMQFVTHARPHAIALLHALRWLPGVQQHVSTSASPGYMKNILALLDPDREIFGSTLANEPSEGKDVTRALPPGDDTPAARAVLVDNRPSCHAPQRHNGILVDDYVFPSRALVLSGGATGNFPAVTPCGTAMIGEDGGLPQGMCWPLEVAPSDASRADRAGKLAFAATRSSNFLRPKRKFAELADEAKAAGAAALLLHAPTQDAPFRVPHDLGLLVVTVGAAAGATLQSADGPVRANLVFREDRELLRVGARLLACWLVPDVRWALTPVAC